MKYSVLPGSGLRLSKLAVGSMTFGEQTSRSEAFDILDEAIAMGINLIDTAEMYPAYPRRETFGDSERLIGDFVRLRGCRDKVVVATKIASCNEIGIGASQLKWIRGGGHSLRFDFKNLSTAVHDSLKRLQMDYIDIIQLHWPERKVPLTDSIDYESNEGEESWTPFEEVLGSLGRLIDQGLVRFVGISNETPWGLCKYLNLGASNELPRPVLTQNSYNLLNRTFDAGLAEISLREQCPLLAYSPLAGGRLTGKYLNNTRPEGARYSVWPGPDGRYHNQGVNEAISKYSEIASNYNISLADMSLAFVLSRPFVASTILGIKNKKQLQEAASSIDINLSGELKEEISLVHQSSPNPAITGIMRHRVKESYAIK